MSTPNSAPYEVLSVDRSKPPRGAEGSDWVRYRISQGSNIITGYRRGSVSSITEAVKEIVAGLNERRTGKRRVSSYRRRPPQAADSEPNARQ